jgi:protein-disulfide isomerase
MLTNTKRKFFSGLALGAAALAFLSVPSPAKAEAFTAEQKEELKKIIGTYISENPQAILDSVENHRKSQEKKAMADATENLAKHKDYLSGKDLPGTGNKDGDVTLVEFFDYNCGYCKRMYQDIVKLIGEDKNLRIVLLDLPILSPASEMMSRYSIAAHKQGKYFELHQALMDYRGEQSEQAYLDVAKGVGLDVEKLKADAADASTSEVLKKNQEIAADIGVQGTPGIVIGEQVFRGYIGLDGVKATIKETREKSAAK